MEMKIEMRFAYIYWYISTKKNYNYSKYSNIIIENKLYDIYDYNKENIIIWSIKRGYYQILERIIKKLDFIELYKNKEGKSIIYYLMEKYIKHIEKKEYIKQKICYENIIEIISKIILNKETITDILLCSLNFNINDIYDIVNNKINSLIVEEKMKIEDIIEIKENINNKSIYELAVILRKNDLVMKIINIVEKEEITKALKIRSEKFDYINSVLYYALYQENEMVFRLLKKIDITYKNVKEVFDVVCINKAYEIIKYILFKIDDREIKQLLDVKFSNLPLYNLIRNPKPTKEIEELEIMILYRMIEKGVNFKHINNEKMSLFMEMIKNKRIKLIKILYEYVNTDLAYMNNRDMNGNNMLFYIIDNGMIEMLEEHMVITDYEYKIINKRKNNILHIYANKYPEKMIEIMKIFKDKKEIKKYVYQENRDGKNVIDILNKKNYNMISCQIITLII